jgi:hypothetical protein
VESADRQAEKWYSYQLTAEEFKAFVEEAKNSPNNAQIKHAYIGDVSDGAAPRIETVTGKPMTKIMIDNGQIRHAYKKSSHNLESDDIFQILDVINNADVITPSDREFLHSPALIFEKDIGGNITFLVQVRAEHDGWLAFASCWRKKKRR